MGLKYQSIHRQQLFYWVGHHIDYETIEKSAQDRDNPDLPLIRRVERRKKKITETMRKAYLDCLADALDPAKGLWSKLPNSPDTLGDGGLIKVTEPITCFTEWSLADSLPHSYKYGRLGFGFSKSWVFLHGGRPVSYVRPALKRDPFNAALLKMAAYFANPEVDPGLAKSFRYITQFIKKVKRDEFDRYAGLSAATACGTQAAERRGDVGQPEKERKPPRERSPEDLLPKYRHNFGGNLEYLEEREWRIVYHSKLARLFAPGPGKPGDKDQPQHYLKIKPGSDLFTVALPDNRTVHRLLHERGDLADRLLKPDGHDAPHVTILSLEDLGTF